MRRAAPFVFLLAACGRPAPRTASVAHALTGTIHAAGASGKGRLAVAWLDPTEAAGWREGNVEGKTFREVIERFRVGPEVDLAGAPTYRIDAPANATPLVVIDVDETFWGTLFGGGKGFVGLGAIGGGDVTVKASPAPTTTAEPCAGDRMELLVVPAAAVAGTVGNPTDRRFCAYLPPSYLSAPDRRYPVVFMFGGFMSNEMVRLRGRSSGKDVADAVAKETGHEAILIGIDASTKTGSTYLEDSPITGQWDSFLSGPALAAVDKRFRTLGTRESRGMIGQSTGGFLAVSFGMRHSDLFGAIGATAPDALDIEKWLFDPSGRAKPWLLAWTRLEAALGGPGQMTSYAADWSPNANGKNLDYPFDLDTGKRNSTLARWVARSPATWLDNPKMVEDVRSRLSGKILIATSSHDEFDLTEPALAFSAKLRAKQIPHELDVTDAGHLAGGGARTEKALRFVISKLTPASGPEAMVVGTEHGGHIKKPGYPLAKLGALIDAYRPDLVLVEIRPKPFAIGHYEDGPIEMSYVTLLAKAHGIPVAPIDWWNEDDLERKPIVFDPEGDRTFERDFETEANALDSYDTFEALNSPERAARVLALRNAQLRLGASDGPPWQRRQSWFHYQATEAVKTFHARRVLAFVGFAHRPELEAYLGTTGIRTINPLGVPAVPAGETVPPDVIAFWESAVAGMRASAKTASPPMKKVYERKSASWERAILQRGRCCTAKNP